MLDQENAAKDVLDIIYELFLNNNGTQNKPEPLQRLIDFLEQSSQLIDEIDFVEEPEQFATDSAISGKSIFYTIKVIINSALKNPDLLAQRYSAFAMALLEIFQQQSNLQPDSADRRFRDPLWQNSYFLRAILQIYLAWKNELQQWLDVQPLTVADKQRVQFIINQLIAALAPSNLPVNPVALKRAEKTQGKSMVAGLINWVQDVCFNRAMPKQIKADAYEVGKDLAITPGAVVYRNEVLELIQYQPQTNKVHRKPILLIPPQINKFYICKCLS
jgi:polyhydroxyalkanoate synthase